MTRPTTPDARRRGRRTLGALLALAVVATAGAPSVITIRPGDTLWDLAQAHGTTVAALRQLNELPGNGTIYVGDRLRLPGGAGAAGSSSNSSSSSSGASHRVRTGETLSQLALRYDVTQRAVSQANGLSDGRIYAGQVLSIPGGSGSSGSTAGVPTTSAGQPVPQGVLRSVVENREVLANRTHPSKAQVRRMVAATAQRHGVPASLAVAVAYHESGFQQRVVSGVNAIGVMQVLPSTGRVLGQQHGQSFDLLDTQDNVTAGVLLLRQLLRSTGSTDEALAGYYQGLGSIARKGVLPQTRSYIRSIDILRGRFANG